MMDSQKKEKKTTGSGELGGPRPGAEGIRRVPSPSSSDNRRGKQVEPQACSSDHTTGMTKDGNGNTIMEAYVSEASSGDDSIPPRKANTNKIKRKRRAILSTSPSGSDATMCSDREMNKRKTWAKPRPPPPPPARSSKRLPTEQERLAELRHAPAASLAVNIMDVADSLEQIAATASNLKGTYIRRLRDDAGKARANATELAKRTTAVGAQIALEQENIQLRAQMLQVMKENEELKKKGMQPEHRKAGTEGKSQTATITERQSQATKQRREGAYQKPTKQASQRMPSRSGRCSAQEEEGEPCTAMREMRALVEQVNALRELVMQRIVREKLPKRSEATRRQESPAKTTSSNWAVEEGDWRGRGRTGKGTERQPISSERERGTTRPTGEAKSDTWARVVGRKEKEAIRKKKRQDTKSQQQQQNMQGPTSAKKRQNQTKKDQKGGRTTIKPPRRAAVALAVAPGSEKKCEDVLAWARERVSLSEIGVQNVRIRYTVAGGILMEIPGEESMDKADNLAEKLKQVFPENGEVRITRPAKKAEIRIGGLDGSIRPEEIKAAVAATGGCPEGEVKLGEIKRRSPRGLSTVWAQCPALAAKKIVDGGKITIGWVAAKVEALKARPATCYRCMERGHTAANCTSEINRSNCYNCGAEGHRARECRAPPRCLVCHDAGRPAGHRFGGRACNPPSTRRKKGAMGASAATGEASSPRPEAGTTAKPSKLTTPEQEIEGCGREEAMEVVT